jgi:hypothetical protein
MARKKGPAAAPTKSGRPPKGSNKSQLTVKGTDPVPKISATAAPNSDEHGGADDVGSLRTSTPELAGTAANRGTGNVPRRGDPRTLRNDSRRNSTTTEQSVSNAARSSHVENSNPDSAGVRNSNPHNDFLDTDNEEDSGGDGYVVAIVF